MGFGFRAGLGFMDSDLGFGGCESMKLYPT